MTDASILAHDLPFRTVLVANRGEIAVRIIRAARDLGLSTVALFGDGEEHDFHVRLADDAFRIPSASAIPYLDIPAIIDVAKRSGAAAIHPGYGFLSENAEFALACQDAGLVFVGPPAPAIAAMGDKIASRRLAHQANVPVVPGSDGAVTTIEEALAWGKRFGYPVAIKASGGGGGRGFRVARHPEEMETAFLGATGEAARSFANPEVYLERYLEHPRHIEVQIMADVFGNVVAVGNRDCSLQRRHQKLLEEAPAVGLSPSTRQAMADAAVALAREVKYVNAGTVEFILAADGTFAFLEMNTRIQVEHPITEATTGIDLVREQFLVAAGRPLSFTADRVAPRGHAIECRINAEDPGQGFAPAPGTIVSFHAPAGMGIRVDTAAASGTRIHPTYDSLIAKVIAWGRDRPEAIARMRRALLELEVTGVPTTRDFHLRVLDHPGWRDEIAATTFIDRFPDVLPPPSQSVTSPATSSEPATDLTAVVNGRRFDVRIHGLDHGSATGSSRGVRPARIGAGNGHTAGATDALLRSPIQGTVVRVPLQEGSVVQRGQTICVIEAMKMENDVSAHRDGVMTRLIANPGMAVRIGDPLAEID
ncbi:MAG: acetyl-CoA carboxylase biotin carboxylase subunit [Thermomicrobiales bacterium]